MLLGHYRDVVPIYGSGGFTTYTDAELREQLRDWVEADRCRWVKMKIGSEPARDPHRVEVAREAIGDHGLFVDAQWRVHPQASARIGANLCPTSSALVRGARLVG